MGCLVIRIRKSEFEAKFQFLYEEINDKIYFISAKIRLRYAEKGIMSLPRNFDFLIRKHLQPNVVDFRYFKL